MTNKATVVQANHLSLAKHEPGDGDPEGETQKDAGDEAGEELDAFVDVAFLGDRLFFPLRPGGGIHSVFGLHGNPLEYVIDNGKERH